MAAGYDGSIKIDTNIDGKGFNIGVKHINKGLGGVITSLKGVSAAIGIAFSVGAIINFSKESVKASTELTNAMTGLQSVMDGQGRSFNRAKQFINDYVSDGLIPATQAITAYKNLALRGYDDSQIQKVLVALKDSAAYGRQSSYTLGQAVESATEGLKNENSILVDNAGVTKNVAKMWDDYAKSIGTTANNLTKQQKIQAEVLGILEETRFQTGDAAKVADSYSGQVLRLSYNFNNLKVSVGNALIPIAQAVLPGINAIINALTRLANVFAQVSAAIFGTQVKSQEQVVESGNDAAASQSNLATATKDVGTATKKTNKELKTALANFDELNVLAKDTTDSMGNVGSTGDIDIPRVDTAGEGELFGNVTVNPKIQEFIDDLRGSLEELRPYTDRVKDAWDRLNEALSRVWEKIEPVVTDFIRLRDELMKNKALNFIAGGAVMLSGALDELSGILLIICGLFTGDWDMALDGAKLAVQGLCEIIEGMLIIVLGKDAVEALKTFISEWSKNISDWWTNDVSPWFTREKWIALWNGVVIWWNEGWNGIKTWWNSNIAAWWVQNVSPWFTREKWIDMMSGVKEGFVITFKNAVNSAIELFNRFIGWVNDKMEFSWNSIKIAGKEIVPAGKVQLFTIPNIPKLATGAVIPPNNEFLAILGDQKGGRNIEAPEGLIRQIMQEELAGMQGNQNVTINFAGNMGQLIRVLKPYIVSENSRVGVDLIEGGA